MERGHWPVFLLRLLIAIASQREREKSMSEHRQNFVVRDRDWCKGEGVHGLSPGIDCEGLLVSLSRFICLELKAGGTLGGRSRTRLTLVAPLVENVKLSVIIVTIV